MTDHIVIVGAGFGGLAVAHALAGAQVKITIIDQRNHHLFQPLLYQVGTASLATSEIAWPIRHLMRRRKEVTTLLGAVNGVDTQNRRVLFEDGGSTNYDTLVLATGARHAYFGHDEWEPFALGCLVCALVMGVLGWLTLDTLWRWSVRSRYRTRHERPGG